MSWIYFIILAAFIWGISVIIDKYLIEKRVKNPLILTIFVRTASLIPLPFVLPFISFSLPGPVFMFFAFLAGLLAAVGVIIYYKSIHIEDVSIVIPLFQFIPVFVLFLSFFLLNEVLGFFDYVGFAVMVLGGLIISTKQLSRIFSIERVFWMVVLASVFYAISEVTLKHTFTNVDYWNAFIVFWLFYNGVILSLLASGKIREQAKSCIKKLGFRDKIIIFFVSIMSFIAHVFGKFALNLGPVTLVEAAMNMELVFIFLLAMVFTIFFPHIIKERFDRKTTVQKALGTVLIITGVLLTQLL